MVIICVALVLFLAVDAKSTGLVTLVTTDASGQSTGGYIGDYNSISSDGRFVLFSSVSTNLPGTVGTNNVLWQQAFIKDTWNGSVSLASEGPNGPGNSATSAIELSDDGRYVLFFSYASNLVAGDTNGRPEKFLKDMQTGAVTSVPTDLAGAPILDVTVKLSGDGRYIAFNSSLPNLITGDTNGQMDVFVKDNITGAIRRASENSTGGQGWGSHTVGNISDDGRYVLFRAASTLGTTGSVFVKDMQTGNLTLASTNSVGENANHHNNFGIDISKDGRYVLMESYASNMAPGDNNNDYDIFVKDVITGNVEVATSNLSGSFVAHPIYGMNVGSMPKISDDGRYVAFVSSACYLAEELGYEACGANHVYLKDTLYEGISLISRSNADAPGNGTQNEYVSMTADARYLAFQSNSTNLNPEGNGGIFLAATDMCSGSKPSLALTSADAYWGNYAEYLARMLSVDFIVTNSGLKAAYDVGITSASTTNGVTSATVMPSSLDQISSGSSRQATIKFSIPAGVGSFKATVGASAQNECAEGYSYP